MPGSAVAIWPCSILLFDDGGENDLWRRGEHRALWGMGSAGLSLFELLKFLRWFILKFVEICFAGIFAVDGSFINGYGVNLFRLFY